ncbi:VP3 [Deltapolyomavirus canis]|nr:VP3 [Deltapolyomavirus canis]AWD33787.1 VP3 [Deltapolyomavirus canis]AWD33793.1 VP3 [Deltapolyomavirus canis]
MALVPWINPELFDIYFPGVSTFSYMLNVVADWGASLFHSLARNVWDTLVRESRAQIAYASRELALRGVQTFQDTMARVIERARWVVTNGPMHAYSALEDYYRALPPVNPAQARAIARRLELKTPDRYSYENTEDSGEVIHKYDPPGGAWQRVTPDWMLPLILGLYGDITPTWSAYIDKLEAEEDGPKKKRRRH